MTPIDYDLAVLLRDAGYPQTKLMGEICYGLEGAAYAPVLTEIKIEIWKLGNDWLPINYQTDTEISLVLTFLQNIGRGNNDEEAAVNFYVMLQK